MDESLLLEPSVAPDLRVQVIFYIFTVNAVFTFVAMLLGAIPYYNYFGLHATQEGFILSFTLSVILYWCLSIATFKQATRVGLGILITWFACLMCVAGFLSGLLQEIAPIHFLTVSYGQSIAMVAYTRYSPRNLDIKWAAVLMGIASFLVCAISLYGFFVENDWVLGAILVLALSPLLLGYNVLAIMRTEGKYDASWDQSVIACLHYYCYDGTALIKYLVN